MYAYVSGNASLPVHSFSHLQSVTPCDFDISEMMGVATEAFRKRLREVQC